MDINLEKEKIRLLEDVQKALNDCLVLLWVDRNKLKPNTNNKKIEQKREKIINICKKWDIDVSLYIDK